MLNRLRQTELAARVLVGAVLAVGLAIISACSSAPDRPLVAERLVVQAATMKVIENAGRPAEKAERIVKAVELAKTLLLDTSVTVDVLRSALLKRVNEQGLPLSEKVLAIEVINVVSAEVESRVGQGLLSPDAIVSINTVLSWVESTASLYVSEPRAT